MPRQDQSSQVGEKIIIKKAYDVDFENMTEANEEEVGAFLKKKMVSMHEVTGTVENAVGEVLTIIDGCITDKEQKKAIKSMIKHSMYDILDTLHALSDDQEA